MDRYNARQASTTFADEPTSTLATSAPPFTSQDGNHSTFSITVECFGKASAQQTISLLSCPDGSGKQSTVAVKHTNDTISRNSSGNSTVAGACALRVTEGCRSCINDFCKEQKREYFLKQKCPLNMAWTRIAGDAPTTMATFEEHAAHSLRSSNSVANLQNAVSRGSHTESSERCGTMRLSQQLQSRTANRHSGTLMNDDNNSCSVHTAEKKDDEDGEREDEECAMPPPRFGHTAVLYREAQIIVFGGKANDEHYYNDVYAYQVERRRWTVLQEELTEEALAAARSSDASFPPSPTLSRTNTSTNSSSNPAVPNLNGVRASSFSAVTPPRESREGSIMNAQYQHQRRSSPQLQQHGPRRTSNGGGNAGNGIEEADLRAGNRTEVFAPCAAPTAPSSPLRLLRPCGRVGHTAALYQNTMYILSGERQGKYYDDMWTLDLETLTWTKECGLPFSPRKGHTMHLLPAECTATRAREDMFVVFGGLVRASRMHPRPADPDLPPRGTGEPDMMCAPTNETLLYYPAQRRWCQLKTCGDAPTPRFYHVSQLVAGTSLLLLFGGRTAAASPAGVAPNTAAGSSAFMNDLHILDVSTGMWREIHDAAGDIPSPRMCAASVFVNGTFAVFAGGGDGYCRNAYEYQLGANRWRRLTPNDQPACSRPTVTYAKDRLVFFGGFAPRIGVMNCTMELCLAPLSLTNQCLLWWNRCAFEKHVRTCTQNRLLEQEEKAAAATAAMWGCRKGSNGCCGKQVTLHRSLTNLCCSPLPTPSQSLVNRGTQRPTPFQRPDYDRTTSWNASMTSQRNTGNYNGVNGGYCDFSAGSPSPSYVPSSPVMRSPLSGTPQSMSPWQDASSAVACTTNNNGAGGLYFASFATATTTNSAFHGSPSNVTSVEAASVSIRPANVFPSRPDAMAASYIGSAPCTATSNTSPTPLLCPSPWQRNTNGPAIAGVGTTLPPQDVASYLGNSNSNNAAAAVCTWKGTVQHNATHSSVPAVTPVSSNTAFAGHRASVAGQSTLTQNQRPLTSAYLSPRESIEGGNSSRSGGGGCGSGGCRIASCMHNIRCFVTTSCPRFLNCQPSPAVHRSAAVEVTVLSSSNNTVSNTIPRTSPNTSGVIPPASAYTSCPSLSSRIRSPVKSYANFSHPLHIDVNDRTPASPQPFEGNFSGHHVSLSPVASPFSLRTQHQTSARFTDSASSRASSAHSVRSTSSEVVPLSHVKQLIKQLEGPNGPFLFRAMAARMQQEGAD